MKLNYSRTYNIGVVVNKLDLSESRPAQSSFETIYRLPIVAIQAEAPILNFGLRNILVNIMNI